jgi:hypothetical protein
MMTEESLEEDPLEQARVAIGGILRTSHGLYTDGLFGLDSPTPMGYRLD